MSLFFFDKLVCWGAEQAPFLCSYCEVRYAESKDYLSRVISFDGSVVRSEKTRKTQRYRCKMYVDVSFDLAHAYSVSDQHRAVDPCRPRASNTRGQSDKIEGLFRRTLLKMCRLRRDSCGCSSQSSIATSRLGHVLMVCRL